MVKGTAVNLELINSVPSSLSSRGRLARLAPATGTPLPCRGTVKGNIPAELRPRYAKQAVLSPDEDRPVKKKNHFAVVSSLQENSS